MLVYTYSCRCRQGDTAGGPDRLCRCSRDTLQVQQRDTAHYHVQQQRDTGRCRCSSLERQCRCTAERHCRCSRETLHVQQRDIGHCRCSKVTLLVQQRHTAACRCQAERDCTCAAAERHCRCSREKLQPAGAAPATTHQQVTSRETLHVQQGDTGHCM